MSEPEATIERCPSCDAFVIAEPDPESGARFAECGCAPGVQWLVTPQRPDESDTPRERREEEQR